MVQLNESAASTYNRNRRYSNDVTRIIERSVGAQPTGRFSNRDARQIFDWQGNAQRFSTLQQDGKFGPQSMGVLITELTRAGQVNEARQLTSYPYELPPGGVLPGGSDTNPILQFRAVTIKPMQLRPFRGGWKASSEFVVRLFLNSSVDCSRYEYRQFIRGSCSTQRGTFSGGVQSFATWTATGSVQNQRNRFAIPGGLSTRFKEDGQEVSGRVFRYGYRSEEPVLSQGLEDRYLPDQANGHEYRARDIPGLAGSGRPVGLRVRLDFHFRGCVVDTQNNDEVIRTLHWGYDGDFIVT